MALSEEELARYARQISLPGWGEEGQSRVSEARVLLAGAGGLGCAAATYLAAAGVGELVICDADRVEPSNLNRQTLYRDDDVGKEKAPVAARRLSEINPHVAAKPLVARIDDGAPELAAGCDVIVDCLDNLEGRFALNRIAIATGIPLVFAAVGGLTAYVSFLRPPETPCLECFLPHLKAPEAPPVPGFFAGTIGSIEAAEAVKHILGVGETLSGRLLVIDEAEPRFDVVRIDRNPACHTCSSLHG